MPSADRRSNIVTTIAPRFDPDLLASFKEYWAFRDPVFGRAILRPAGEIYTLDSLMPREEFAATPVFNELWRPARWGFATAGANLVAGDQFSALVCISNAPGKELTDEQLRLFKSVARHLGRAVRINRQLWKLELKHLAFSPMEPFDTARHLRHHGQNPSGAHFREDRYSSAGRTRPSTARRRRSTGWGNISASSDAGALAHRA
jgi:hypothetical protein